MPTLTDREKWQQGLIQLRVIIKPGDEYYTILKQMLPINTDRLHLQYTLGEDRSMHVGSCRPPLNVPLPQLGLVSTLLEALQNDDLIVVRGSASVITNILWGVPFVVGRAAGQEDGVGLHNKMHELITRFITSKEPIE